MKIIITGLHCSGKQEVLDLLKDENFKCGQMFSNIKENVYNNYKYKYFDENTIEEIFENNAYIYIKQLRNRNDLATIYEGISKYDWDNNDIFALDIDVVTNINNTNEEIIYVWCDNQWNQRYDLFVQEGRKYVFDEVEHEQHKYTAEFYDRLYNSKNGKVIYFTNEDPVRIKTIIKILLKYPEMKDEIIASFN